MTTAFIALGSNLQCPTQQLRAAAGALAQLPQSRLTQCSAVYRTAAVGPGEQPDYLNAVAALTTTLAPVALLDLLQQIERRQGRVREQHWGARTLDLDIVLFGDAVIDTPRLKIPHTALAERNFVLVPLADIAGPELTLPDGRRLVSLLAHCPPAPITRTDIALCETPAG